MFRRVLTVLLALAFAGPVNADARQELHTAFVKNLALKSFKATTVDLATKRPASTVEFQAPDRYRVAGIGEAPSIIIGDTMYLNINGRYMKIPLPKQTLGQYRNEAAIKQLAKTGSVVSLGPGMVGSEPARKYRWISTGDMPASNTVWVGIRSGNVLQIESIGSQPGKRFGVRVLYSDFNSPKIRINPPKL